MHATCQRLRLPKRNRPSPMIYFESCSPEVVPSTSERLWLRGYLCRAAGMPLSTRAVAFFLLRRLVGGPTLHLSPARHSPEPVVCTESRGLSTTGTRTFVNRSTRDDSCVPRQSPAWHLPAETRSCPRPCRAKIAQSLGLSSCIRSFITTHKVMFMSTISFISSNEALSDEHDANTETLSLAEQVLCYTSCIPPTVTQNAEIPSRQSDRGLHYLSASSGAERIGQSQRSLSPQS